MMNEALIFAQTLRGWAASENKQVGPSTGVATVAASITAASYFWHHFPWSLQLMVSWTLKKSVKGQSRQRGVHQPSSFSVWDILLGQILFNILVSEPLLNAPLTSIGKKSPSFSFSSVARHQTDMDFDASIFSPSHKNYFFSRLYFFISQGTGCKE